MKRLILTGVLGLAAGLTFPLAQAQKGLVAHTKSQGESQAVMALMQAQQAGPDAMIKAADELITQVLRPPTTRRRRWSLKPMPTRARATR